MIRKPALLFILIVIYDVIFIYYYLFVLFISIINFLVTNDRINDFTNDLWCFKPGDYFPLFLIVIINVFYMQSLFITFYLLMLF